MSLWLSWYIEQFKVVFNITRYRPALTFNLFKDNLVTFLCNETHLQWFLQGGRVQTRLGILMLLATWMADCTTAVAHFLFNTANVPYVSFVVKYFSLNHLSSLFYMFNLL